MTGFDSWILLPTISMSRSYAFLVNTGVEFLSANLARRIQAAVANAFSPAYAPVVA